MVSNRLLSNSYKRFDLVWHILVWFQTVSNRLVSNGFKRFDLVWFIMVWFQTVWNRLVTNRLKLFGFKWFDLQWFGFKRFDFKRFNLVWFVIVWFQTVWFHMVSNRLVSNGFKRFDLVWFIMVWFQTVSNRLATNSWNKKQRQHSYTLNLINKKIDGANSIVKMIWICDLWKVFNFFCKEKDKMLGLVGLNGEKCFLQVLFIFFSQVCILILYTYLTSSNLAFNYICLHAILGKFWFI